MKTESTAPDTATLLEFMFRLGQAHLACGEQTAKVELILRRTASAYGRRKSRVVAFPTALFISIHDETGERVTLVQCEPQTLRLDQIADVYALGEAAQKAGVAPGEGLQRLSAILAQKARFGAAGIVVGHTILTVGLAMVLMPTAANLAAAAGLGFIVGAVKLSNRGRAVLAVPLPVIAAALVSALVFLAVRYGLPVDPLHALVPPLITFLPGGMLADRLGRRTVSLVAVAIEAGALFAFAFGNPELAPWLTGYLGLFLLGAAALAVGLFFSSLTENQIVAAILTFLTLLLFLVLNWLSQIGSGSWQGVVGYLSLSSHFEDLPKGIFDLKDAVYFVSLAGFGLFLAHSVLQSRRWR